MIDNFEAPVGLGDSENGFQHFLYSFWPVNVDGCFAAQQPERGNKARQTEEMVAMEVGNKYMVDLGKTCFCLAELHLSTLATVDQEMTLLHFQELRGR